MSKIGKRPIEIPEGVEVKIEGQKIKIRGEKGELTREVSSEIEVKREGKRIFLSPRSKEKKIKALWGLERQLIFNMIKGVSEGFEKRLEIVGLGYKAELKENKIYLYLGRATPSEIEIPPGIGVRLEKNFIIVSGIDKEKVGNFAAKIRKEREPDPYKGKGIRYFGEEIKLKPGKKAVGKEA